MQKYLLAIVFAAMFANAGVTKSAETVLFIAPPAPQELADILFKPRYRSVNGHVQPAENAFGMMVNFSFDSTRILPDSLALLDSVGEMLRLERVANEVLVIEGHTDSTGTERYNHGLSERRAEAIKHYLVESFAIDPQRLVTLGKGEVDLYDLKHPENPLNRRAVFKPLSNISVD